MKPKAILPCLLLISAVCSGWGFLVHRTTTQLAIYKLPSSMQPFFFENSELLVKTSVRPDQRRANDKNEDPKHFIDLEAFGDSAAWRMPKTMKAAAQLYPLDTLKKYGYGPYWVISMKEKLTTAFRSLKKDSILYYAADLAHYIGDAHVPLHTTLNYDGQLTGQKGLHSLWESMIPEIELTGYDLYTRHEASYLKNPETKIWTAVRTAHKLLGEMLQEEIEASKGFTDSTKYRTQIRNGKETKSYSTAFARAYSKRLGKTINQQLQRSANLIADFWYTAWVDAGKPKLKTLLHEGFTAKEKAQLKKELKSFRNNNLLKDKLLIARQEADET
jgi:hypothetical protein